MKKTLNISIASRLFNLEEDAYHKLDQYLSSIKHHFNGNPDKDEIIADIEERIAEHFLESKTGIITLADVESLIKTMGTVDQFDEPHVDEPEETDTPKTQGMRRLFRDPDNAIVAGVAAGIAHYFGINPLIIRIIFAVSIFAGGAGILIYIVLWLVVPEAKTASQKLLMHGDPVTLETLSETVRDRIDEIKTKDTSGFRKLIVLPFKIIGSLIKFLVGLVPKILRIFFALILTFFGVTALVFIMIGTGFITSGDLLILEGVTLKTFIPGFVRYLILFGTALVVMIPAFFALIGGISLFKKKNIITSYITFGLLGIWLIALAISGFGIAKVANRYDTLVQTSPIKEQVTVTKAITEEFDALEIQNGLTVQIISGTTTLMQIKGEAESVNAIQATVVNNKLTIKRERPHDDRFCLLCFTHDGSVEIILSVTDPLEAITVLHGSSLTGDLLDSTKLTLDIENGSNVDFVIRTENLVANILHGSHVNLEGNSLRADLSLEHGSVLEAKKLQITNAKISTLHGSRADIHVSKTLDAKAEHGSIINYTGNPEVRKNNANGSSIQSEN